MSKQAARESALIRKIRSLPPKMVAEVENFVESLVQRDDRELTHAAAKLAEKRFRRIWDNPADAAYDRPRPSGAMRVPGFALADYVAARSPKTRRT
jgi:hypothetical protein